MTAHKHGHHLASLAGGAFFVAAVEFAHIRQSASA